MQLDQITPLILAFNEAPNIGRVLERLQWAKQILVIDSFSTDETLGIISEFPNTTVLQRQFDHPTEQDNFGLQNVKTRWTLSLDSDYLCPENLPEELVKLDENCGGYAASFRYCVFGRPLRGTLYPVRVVLYQTALAKYLHDGHTQRVSVNGEIRKLTSVIDHDDRKPFQRWLKSQATYASREADKILSAAPGTLKWKDRLRTRLVFAPFLTVFYCLFFKLLILDGLTGLYYTLQRVYAELLLSLELLDRRLMRRDVAERPLQPRENAKAAV